MLLQRTATGTDIAKGAVSGMIAGLAATWAMSESQAWWTRLVEGREPQSASGRHDARDWQERTEGQNANELAAEAIGERALDRPLTRRELEAGAAATHYGFGATVGAAYGALAEVSPQITMCSGTCYGTFVWAAADEVAVPLLGLSDPTTERPVEAHAQALAAHLVFGLTLEVVRRTLRRIL